jgi:hypothetical protein
LIHRLKTQGHANREIARRVGVSEMAVRKLLRRMGWKELGSEQTKPALEQAPAANPNLLAFCSPDQARSSTSQDRDPTDRRGDRLLAYLGLLDDAPPLFGSGASIPRAGVLLVLPALVQSGNFACAGQIYGSLGPAFYGLRTSLLTPLDQNDLPRLAVATALRHSGGVLMQKADIFAPAYVRCCGIC